MINIKRAPREVQDQLWEEMVITSNERRDYKPNGIIIEKWSDSELERDLLLLSQRIAEGKES